MQNSLMRKPIEIKISTVVAVAILLHQAATPILEAALKEMCAGSPDFFDNEFAVIDVESIADTSLDWDVLIPLFKSYGLHTVAVRHAREEDHAAIRAHGLAIDVVAKPRMESELLAAAQRQATPAPAPEPQVIIRNNPALVIDTPVRAGQRIYARGADLIITAAVNNGAEVIADGSIHIYAPLRGRALAGATGNTEARIFALTMEPELVSIAGIYRTFEHGYPELPAKYPVQVRLNGDSIEVSSVKSSG
ncbi:MULTISPECIES: septum site-determining protein MinC [unclassified Undibacterium]|uniref:septum site-determining protein MinC n=1 Tax=unclassified Undibacterium TaxID=2630295 RepID=UPI002AC8EC17|nr:MULTISPECIES: septum site-determining protein MinC [unclassified Undibacterium]MEB0140215.1 septum site-determining protein MinC [Undibacterium sp. CCC2.1]MEB0173246.1 septum site-determining protein MinC [Undibacterium sp. CCC1.1]MEB0177065.1 septum site-determining protein MinC [Undibacterium sp. CCC3.4]MEB0216354.1 septum site-determining protein MinC [Undibacterium sp. 5I2]WPX45207.1 septum site-determining protein MinC [Undibacterium sp. CCC3.4]